MNVKKLVKQALTEEENWRYRKRLAGIQLGYKIWLHREEGGWDVLLRQSMQKKEEEQSKAGEHVQGGGTAQGERGFVLILAAPGGAGKNTAKKIERYFEENPDAVAVYGDEDVRTEDGEYTAPWFKPDWSPDLLDSFLYMGSLVAVRREAWEKAQAAYGQIYPGEWQQLFSGNVSRVTDLAAYEKWLHMLLKDAYQKGSRMVGHIPQVLYHASNLESQEAFFENSAYLQDRRRELLDSFLENAAGDDDGRPMVSVVIPSKDHPDILRRCVEGVKLAGADIPFEIIVVDNGSGPENKAKIERLLEEASAGENKAAFGYRYLYRPMEFNFSRMCNLGAEEAEGKLLLFLNDDVVLREGCMAEAAARAVRDYTGAVGMKLLYPDTNRIQHAGITNLPMGPVHKLQGLQDDKVYYGKANRGCRNFLAVTAACLMVEKEKFREAEGFCETLEVAFNDVDFCFRLHELGYFNVCLNDIYAYHHESLSRGDDEVPEKMERLQRERKKLYERHPALEEADPYYSPSLNSVGLDVRIAPAYETCGNLMQFAYPIRIIRNIASYREDKCLMVRVEDVQHRTITGWSVVLGDNNACYQRKFLLRSVGQGTVYAITLKGQYRPDLEYNMPDQKNVALGGFQMYLGQDTTLEGDFQIGICVRNRVTGLRLVNWSNRIIHKEGREIS